MTPLPSTAAASITAPQALTSEAATTNTTRRTRDTSCYGHLPRNAVLTTMSTGNGGTIRLGVGCTIVFPHSQQPVLRITANGLVVMPGFEVTISARLLP